MSHSCPITLNHGVIGKGRVPALVSPTTHVDWLFMPRFDSASVFARILDQPGLLYAGAFSEDVGPRSGMLLGHVPQAYTHVGLINTAVTISELLEARDARFHAWS